MFGLAGYSKFQTQLISLNLFLSFLKLHSFIALDLYTSSSALPVRSRILIIYFFSSRTELFILNFKYSLEYPGYICYIDNRKCRQAKNKINLAT